MATVFETETCGRCGGTGHYSYNQINGTTCFGCNGKKVSLTKRGKAAQSFFRNSMVCTAAEIVAGDKVIYNGKFCTVVAVSVGKESAGKGLQPDGSWKVYPPATIIEFKGVTLHTAAEAAMSRVKDETERQAKLAAAVTYQGTLTKEGKARK